MFAVHEHKCAVAFLRCQEHMICCPGVRACARVCARARVRRKRGRERERERERECVCVYVGGDVNRGKSERHSKSTAFDAAGHPGKE